MIEHPRRRLLLLLTGGATAAALGTTTVVLLVPHDRTPLTHVALPSVSAGPRHVTAVYLDALEQGDLGTAEALIAPNALQGFQHWFSDGVHISNVEVGRVFPGSTAAYVEVSFDIEGADISMPDGPTTWGFMVKRAEESPRWLIYDQGTG